MKKFALPVGIIFLVLLIDQLVKIWIKTHMFLGQEYHVAGNWFIIHFTENNGMAFGLEWGGVLGKFALSIFRIAAVGAIGYYLLDLCKKQTNNGLVICISLIFAGAVGNIIDSVFYGIAFDYAGVLQGKVVDMLYFPLIDTTWPTWMPIWGGQPFQFFQPVFNIADAAISTGVIAIILFQRKLFFAEPATA